MARWFIFKCQNCNRKFKEKFTEKFEKVDIGRIGASSYITATHFCKDGTYGCGKLIGAEIRTRKTS